MLPPMTAKILDVAAGRLKRTDYAVLSLLGEEQNRQRWCSRRYIVDILGQEARGSLYALQFLGMIRRKVARRGFRYMYTEERRYD